MSLRAFVRPSKEMISTQCARPKTQQPAESRMTTRAFTLYSVLLVRLIAWKSVSDVRSFCRRSDEPRLGPCQLSRDKQSIPLHPHRDDAILSPPFWPASEM